MTNVKSTENDKLRGNTEYEIKAQNFSKIVFFFRMSLRYEMFNDKKRWIHLYYIKSRPPISLKILKKTERCHELEISNNFEHIDRIPT